MASRFAPLCLRASQRSTLRLFQRTISRAIGAPVVVSALASTRPPSTLTATRNYTTPPSQPVTLPAPQLGFLALRDLGFIPLGILIDVMSNLALQPPVSTATSVLVSGGIFALYKLRERARQRLELAVQNLADARLKHELAENAMLRETLKLKQEKALELLPYADALFPLINQTPFDRTETVNGVFQIKDKPFTEEAGLFLIVVSGTGKTVSEESGKKQHGLQLTEFAVLRVKKDRSVDKLVVSEGLGDDMFTALL